MATVNLQRDPVERQKIFFQFITTPTADTTGTSLLLYLNSQRYLFGHIAEGTQRACIQRGVGLKKVRNFFLTGEIKWANNGGLIGLLLTLADVQAEELVDGRRQPLHIFGGPKLWHTMACARRFVFRTGMPLKVYEKSADDVNATVQPDYSDDNIDVWSIAGRGQRERKPANESTAVRPSSPNTVRSEQQLRQKTVHDMFDSDWKLDRLFETPFKDVGFPAMVWVRSPESKELHATFCTKTEDAPHIALDQIVLVRTPWPAAMVTELPSADNLPSAVSMSYVVKCRPQRGKFNALRAKELGVPPGPLNGKLAQGESVTLEDGKVIKSEDVMSATEPGRGMIVLDIPHPCYIEDVMSQLSQLQKSSVLDGIEAICWILGSDVVKSEEFKAARTHFKDLKHIISSPETCSNTLAMDSSAAASARLSQTRSDVYLVPSHDNTPLLKLQDLGLDDAVSAERGLMVRVAPAIAIDKVEVPHPLNIPSIVNQCKSDIRGLLPSSDSEHAAKYSGVEVITLGTGSAAPSKYRNVSSNLVHIPGSGYILLDVGEGTLGQLRRIYTPDELENVLCDLRLIWISHLHADHHLGTISILAAREKAIKKRHGSGKAGHSTLHLISEKNMIDFLLDYQSVEAFDCVLLRVANSKLTDALWNPVEISHTALPIKDFQTCMVKHCHGAQAVSIAFDNGFKISYSGDCRPSHKFAEIGVNSDVLIHEATFDDGLEGDAKAKRHCTTAEALGVAIAMKAKNVVLTHFSQRYQKLPVLTNIVFPGQIEFEEGEENGEAEEPEVEGIMPSALTSETQAAEENGELSNASNSISILQKIAAQMNVCVAFDLMRVSVSQIKDMHKYYPAIERIFQIEQAKRDADRSVKRHQNEQVLKKNSQPKVFAQNGQINKYEAINRSKTRPQKKTSKSDASAPKLRRSSVSGMHSTVSNVAACVEPRVNADVVEQTEALHQFFPLSNDSADTDMSIPESKWSSKRYRSKSKEPALQDGTANMNDVLDQQKRIKLNENHP